VIEGVELFDVGKVFDCGQCFRFDPVKNSTHETEFAGCAYGKYISVAQDGDKLYVYNATVEEYENIWSSFLGLDRNYSEINDSILSLSKNPALADAIDMSSGIRILKQDEWEAICSFIISANNNIPRIKGIIENLSKKYGTPIGEFDGQMRYSFPTPEALFNAGVDEIFALKTGFRAKYIFDAAKKVYQNEINLEDILKMNTQDAMQELMKIKGVGPKVALCTLLFGFGKHDAFPVDVWVKRIMAEMYPEGLPEIFKGNEGIAQQYLFHWRRNRKE
jgi:N-glycosylase/DNA lyase